MKVLIDIPDSVGPDLDRLRALVGDTAMVMTILGDDLARIIELFGITLDQGHLPERLIVRGVVVGEDSDDVSDYAVIEPVRRDDEKQAIREGDEATRLKYEACPGCGKDLGADAEALDQCPHCGEEL